MQSWAEVVVPRLAYSQTIPALSLTNSMSNLKQPLPLKDTYRMYVCGITPYDATHLGHAATYLTFDLVQRYLRAQGSSVNYVQNITDIDDPLLERAQRDGIDWRDLATSQINLFRSDMVALRVIPPQHYIGAVEAIPLVVKAIENLAAKGTTYLIDKDLYFTNSIESGFGGLSHLDRQTMESIFAERGGDPTLPGKRGSLDCLVWMSQRQGEPGWESTLGTGRPGWHIECTAIAYEYLSPSSSDHELIDIQGGGSDLIFPHHEMCRSQAKVLTGKELAANYVHAGMLGLDGEKMSKSKGNLVFVSSLIAQGVNPIAIRYALMKNHYREDRMWTNEILDIALMDFAKIQRTLTQSNVAPTDLVIPRIIAALADDLDTPLALQIIMDWVSDSHDGSTGGDAHTMRNCMDSLMGLVF